MINFCVQLVNLEEEYNYCFEDYYVALKFAFKSLEYKNSIKYVYIYSIINNEYNLLYRIINYRN